MVRVHLSPPKRQRTQEIVYGDLGLCLNEKNIELTRKDLR